MSQTINRPLLYNWFTSSGPRGRIYVAMIHANLTLNVFRHFGSGYWEWAVIGYNLVEDDRQLAWILRSGTAQTMKEAKTYAENTVKDTNPPPKQGTLWISQNTQAEEVPF